MIKDGVAIGTLQASQLKRFPSEQYKCFMQIRRHPPTHILTGAVVRLNQYVSPHRPRIAYSQKGPAPVLGLFWDPHRPRIAYSQRGPAYLIIVADAADAVSVNFSGRCKFLQI